jgi:hypothetical protein
MTHQPRDYTRLPEPTPLEDTVAEHDTRTPADPDAVRNADQHAALRDD